jgi:hypothetical protein
VTSEREELEVRTEDVNYGASEATFRWFESLPSHDVPTLSRRLRID